jgi:hypothetical protein
VDRQPCDDLALARNNVRSRRHALGGFLTGALALLGRDDGQARSPFDTKRSRRDSHHKLERGRTRVSEKKRFDTPNQVGNAENKKKNRKNDSDDKKRPMRAKAANHDDSATKALLWTTLFPTNLTRRNIQKIAAAHFSGFQIDNLHGGVFDDIQNGGVSRMKRHEYRRVSKAVSNAVRYSQNLGMDSLFIRLTSANFDVFHQEDIDKMIQAVGAQAAFARNAGLRGIWFDAEDYNSSNIWNQDQDPGKIASGREENEVRDKYVEFGSQFMQVGISEYPELELLLAPSLHISNYYPSYKHLPAFYAGLASVKSRNSIVVTTELSYDYSGEDELLTIMNDEMTYLVDDSYVALGFWPRDESEQSIKDLEEAVRRGRQYSPKYHWVYDQAGIFVQDAPHSCLWEGWDAAHSCLAKPLQERLPPLSPSS